MNKRIAFAFALHLILAPALHAELKLPAIFSDHMVLQQKQSNPVWGWDTPGTPITVTFAGRDYPATAGSDGKWTVKLAPAPANATGQSLTIKGTSTRQVHDVLIGEVWMCSGQSNMGFPLASDYNGDLEAAASKLPQVRLLKVPLLGTQELQTDFKGHWMVSTPESARSFSAVGFLFGRYLHQILGVPVGLIDNAWGGSSAEAWVRRSSLEQDPRFERLMAATRKHESELQTDAGKSELARALAQWQVDSQKAKAQGKQPPGKPEEWLTGRHRPGNIFAGMLSPTLGYGIKGVVWYQGESNAGHAWEYRELFPFLIEQWRREWGQGDFPFYWVQLADYHGERSQPGESEWAELREAQTRTLKLPHTGQAVIIDLGEGKNIHPRNKHDVAARLVRWALVQDYGMKLPYHSPEFKSMLVCSNKVLVNFDGFGSPLRTFDVDEARGFALCGADKVWHWAKGRLSGPEQVEVWSDQVPAPVAVRYAWADNPVCNLTSETGLPATPFRSDDFELSTQPKEKPASAER